MGKLDVGTHVLSAGKKFRQMVKISLDANGKKFSETYHEELIGGRWCNRPPSPTMKQAPKPEYKRQNMDLNTEMTERFRKEDHIELITSFSG